MVVEREKGPPSCLTNMLARDSADAAMVLHCIPDEDAYAKALETLGASTEWKKALTVWGDITNPPVSQEMLSILHDDLVARERQGKALFAALTREDYAESDRIRSLTHPRDWLEGSNGQ